MLRCLLLICCLALCGACQNVPHAFNDVHTGKRGFVSSQMMAYASPSGLVLATAGYSQSSDVFVIFTELRNFTGLYVYPKEVWSFGEKIPYANIDRMKVSCSGGCTAIESGKIILSRDAFEAAGQNGLEFRLVGRRASILCKLPPEIFQQVLRPMGGRRSSYSNRSGR